jgi:hypothetical protein
VAMAVRCSIPKLLLLEAIMKPVRNKVGGVMFASTMTRNSVHAEEWH